MIYEKKKTFYLDNKKGYRLYTEIHLPSQNMKLKGMVQIAHGMRESTEYYSEFFTVLNDAGYIAVIHDARGHGRSAGEPFSSEFNQNAGKMGDDGLNGMAEDLKMLTDLLLKEYPHLPVFLFGHSMGSILSRLYISKYGDILSGVILSGTAGPMDNKKYEILINTAIDEAEHNGRNTPSVKTPTLFFGHFNERFQPAETGFEYMTRDKAMEMKAISSPFINIPYSNGFYIDFINSIHKAGSDESICKVPKELPVLSVSGDMDPFGDYGEGIKQLFKLYRKHELQDIHYNLYHEGRHEMLREINRHEVFNDIMNWLDRH